MLLEVVERQAIGKLYMGAFDAAILTLSAAVFIVAVLLLLLLLLQSWFSHCIYYIFVFEPPLVCGNVASK